MLDFVLFSRVWGDPFSSHFFGSVGASYVIVNVLGSSKGSPPVPYLQTNKNLAISLEHTCSIFDPFSRVLAWKLLRLSDEDARAAN